MKKVLTILVVLTVIAGFAFADTNKSITLTTEIDKIAPEFELTVKNGNNEYVTADQPVASLAAEGGVSAQFKVSQIGDARLANDKVATLTVTCGEFFLYENNVKKDGVHSAVPSIADAANAAKGTRTNLSYAEGSAVATNNAVKFMPQYNGFVAAGDIGTFTANWAKEADLPAGTYKADVTLAYEAL